MDSVTHTLFGLTLYGAVNKQEMDKPMRRSLLFTAVVGSLIPDIDVISQLWDTQGMYQMWHRGITHSVFLVPVWALVLFAFCRLFWKVKDRRLLFYGLLAVFIHNTSDLFNAWGTGYLEPFSSVRITFGTIPIVDLTVWTFILAGFVLVRLRKWNAPKVYKTVWLFILLHFFVQSAQGFALYNAAKAEYDQLALSAGFAPAHFTVIGKKGDTVEISEATVWSEPELRYTLASSSNADLDYLFAQNPRAKTLYEWSPFVVIVSDEDRIAVYDPRFYRNGQSFLYEAASKQ